MESKAEANAQVQVNNDNHEEEKSGSKKQGDNITVAPEPIFVNLTNESPCNKLCLFVVLYTKCTIQKTWLFNNDLYV